ncbi:YegS/Rv2252/BmrU family lipid kinase [Ornithinibacillus sp. L9]|uniref:YegS/Rv2252/BmrU family lipid kinase n=1 Tax=Ornithinibacillus caprae TaxID=2678566 RepID=A0A6N8FGR4_9BACI|nr:YegS/Rv2252/BmrU family lipid kinase [Ornithinibacillus caprae]MUK86919.1 YegS/Rv2252/BmrU family lipid kinase [Ornithinibacillus caprae]
MGKLALMIYNPVSGKKRNHKYTEILLVKLKEIGYKVTVNSSNEWKENEEAIQEACKDHWDAIFIAGGDGTIKSTLQCLAEQNYRPTLGIFPFGTSNEFAKFIGMPSNLMEVLSIIKKGKTKKVDIGKFGNRYFANIAAGGWLTDITYKTPTVLKTYFGEFAYCLYFIKAILHGKQSNKISIRVTPKKELSDLSNFIIMNGNSVGPLESLITNTTPLDNGYFHLLTCKKTNRIRLFFALFAKMLHLTETVAPLNYYKIKSGSFSTSENVIVNLDGDQVDVDNMEFVVLPHHIQVFVP